MSDIYHDDDSGFNSPEIWVTNEDVYFERVETYRFDVDAVHNVTLVECQGDVNANDANDGTVTAHRGQMSLSGCARWNVQTRSFDYSNQPGGSYVYVHTSTDMKLDVQLVDVEQNGVEFEQSRDCYVTGHIRGAGTQSDDTYDAVQINGGSRIFVTGLTIRPEASTGELSRYGVNVVDGDCHIVVGNDLGDPADYGTDALNDTATNTALTWPSDATYGDNFTDCSS
jgi:hypothetical protein